MIKILFEIRNYLVFSLTPMVILIASDFFYKNPEFSSVAVIVSSVLAVFVVIRQYKESVRFQLESKVEMERIEKEILKFQKTSSHQSEHNRDAA